MTDGFNRFKEISDALSKEIQAVVEDTAKSAKKHIQEAITANNQVRTGYMRDSVYVVTENGSDYVSGSHALPEVAPPDDEATAFVIVAADYAAPQNYGTRFLPARPFFEPGIEQTVRDFEDNLKNLFGGL